MPENAVNEDEDEHSQRDRRWRSTGEILGGIYLYLFPHFFPPYFLPNFCSKSLGSREMVGALKSTAATDTPQTQKFQVLSRFINNNKKCSIPKPSQYFVQNVEPSVWEASTRKSFTVTEKISMSWSIRKCAKRMRQQGLSGYMSAPLTSSAPLRLGKCRLSWVGLGFRCFRLSACSGRGCHRHASSSFDSHGSELTGPCDLYCRIFFTDFFVTTSWLIIDT